MNSKIISDIRRGKKCHVKAITLTFRHDMSHRLGFKLLSIVLCNQTFVDYVFYPEYGDHGNFHYHGTIWYTNKLHYYSFMNYWKRLYGFTKESNLNNLVQWHLYCIKQQSMFRFKRISYYNHKDYLFIQTNKNT